jgi:hypothetical protein
VEKVFPEGGGFFYDTVAEVARGSPIEEENSLFSMI